MSEIARELKMLFYLNEKKSRNQVASISELSELLEISPRQVRRYREDLDQAGFTIHSKAGVNGGYYLDKSFDSSLAIPDNILLALSIALKNNTNIFKELNQLPVVSGKLVSQIEGDHYLSNETLDKEILIVYAIQNKKMISFSYEQNENKEFLIKVEPYRLIFSNREYYLKAYYKGNVEGLRVYSVDKMKNIKEEETFNVDSKILEKINIDLNHYGIIHKHDPIILELEYSDRVDEYAIRKYFENKVIFEENKRCKISTINIEECFYPIFSLDSKVKIMDEQIKERYITYLQRKIKIV